MKLLFAGFAFLFSLSGYTQDAQAILNDVAGKVKGASTITSKFTLNVKDKNGSSVQQTTGNLILKGDKYFIKQGKDEIYCNAKKIWNYDGAQEVLVSNVNATDEDDYTPAKMMAVDFNKDYSYKLVADAGNAYTIRLVPLDKRKPVKTIDVYADKQKKMITKAIVEDKTGNTTYIIFSDVVYNTSFPDNTFEFSAAKHPGVEVIEQ